MRARKTPNTDTFHAVSIMNSMQNTEMSTFTSNAEKYGPEKTPNLGTIHAVVKSKEDDIAEQIG